MYRLTLTATEKEVEVEILISELYFKLECKPGTNLDGAALPRFQCERSVKSAHVVGCAAPAAGYGALLRGLRVAPQELLRLSGVPSVRLARAQLEGLPPLRALAVGRWHLPAEPRLQADADFLAPLAESLRSLYLAGVALSPAALRALPRGLRKLEVADAALACEDGCAAALRRLPELRTLRLSDARLHASPALSAAAALRAVYVDAPLRQPLLSKESAIENATFL